MKCSLALLSLQSAQSTQSNFELKCDNWVSLYDTLLLIDNDGTHRTNLNIRAEVIKRLKIAMTEEKIRVTKRAIKSES